MESGPHFFQIAVIHLALGVDGLRPSIDTGLLKYSLALIGNLAFIVVDVSITLLTVMVYISILLEAILLQG